MDRDRKPQAVGGGIQSLGRGQSGDALNQLMSGQIPDKIRRCWAEHQNGTFQSGPSQGHALGQTGHGEHVGTRGQGGPGHLDGAVTVAVGLDHRHQAGRGRRDAPQFAHVVGNGRQIDLGPYMRMVHRWASLW